MTTDNPTNVESDVKALFDKCNAELIQIAIFHTTLNKPDDIGTKVLALTDSEGIRRVAEEVDADVKPRKYPYFGLDSPYLLLGVARAHDLPTYGIEGFKVERPGYQLNVAAFIKE